MRDRRQDLRARLGPLGLRHEREEEILAELSEHLEDQSAAEAERALPPQSRIERIEEGTDWNLLARQIRQAEEEPMRPTARTLWVPGVGMLFCSFFLLLAITRWVPPAAWVDPSAPTLLLAPWLLSYLGFGALGAWWSRRVGGTTAFRFFSGMFPLALHLAVFSMPILVAIASDARLGTSTPLGLGLLPERLQAGFLLRAGLEWVVIPGVALAIGTLPFLRDSAGSLGPANPSANA
jgi:hypothetical protein